MLSRRRKFVATAAVVLAGAAGAGAGASQCNNPTPAPPTTTTTSTTVAPTTTSSTAPAPCLASPAAAIAALPSGATWDGNGACYTVPGGLTVSQPVTLENATFNDSDNSLPAKGDIKPILKVLDTHDVTIENVNVVGVNVKGAYSPTLAKGAGFSVLSSSNVTLTNDTSTNTFGDGLYLMGNFPKDKLPVSNLTVNGFTVTNAGRNGLTPADVTNSTITTLVVNSSGLVNVDFESDLTGVGAGNLNFVGGNVGGVHVSETLTGPVTFTNSAVGRVFQTTSSTVPAAFPVAFVGCTLTIPPHKNGIFLKGPVTFVFTHTAFVRSPEVKDAPVYSLTDGANLTLNQSPLPPPAGTADASSTVTINP